MSKGCVSSIQNKKPRMENKAAKLKGNKQFRETANNEKGI
jgi:hypothetical protein